MKISAYTEVSIQIGNSRTIDALEAAKAKWSTLPTGPKKTALAGQIATQRSKIKMMQSKGKKG